jgi:hypothetical protein
MYRPTPHGPLLLADDTDSHLVAHAQLQDETYTLLGLPLRALYETAQLDFGSIDFAAACDRFAAAGVPHVLSAHLDAASRLFGRPELDGPSGRRAAAHTRLAEAGVAAPALTEAWTYAVRVPRSFTEARMHEEFGPGSGRAWLWGTRARHVARRVSVRVGRRGH